MGQIFEGQKGVRIELETFDDLSGATLTEIKFKKPGGEKGIWPGAVDGTKIFFLTTVETELDKRGMYQVQAHVSGPGFDALGETAEFKVDAPWG